MGHNQAVIKPYLGNGNTAWYRPVLSVATVIIQACYENPLFAEDEDKERAENGKASTGPRSLGPTQDGRVPTNKDYMHSLPPAHDIRFKCTTSRHKLVKFGIRVFIAAVLIGIVIGLIVHFVHDSDSSIRTTSPVIRCQQIQGSLKIIDGPFSIYRKEYDDTSSGFYGILLQSFQFTINHILKNSHFKDLYSSVDILRISEGSVTIHFVIHLRETQVLSSADMTELLTLIQNGLKDSILPVSRDSVTLVPEVCSIASTDRSSGLPNVPERCQTIKMSECINITNYHTTTFPNLLGHGSQDMAALALMNVIQMLSVNCHSYAKVFLCALHFPQCGPGYRPIPPCRSFCEVVFSRCNASQPGIKFPVDCAVLPDSDDARTCTPNPYKPGICIPVTAELCLQEGFNRTSFPTVNGDQSELEVESSLQLIKGLEVATACYKHSMLFGCSVFLPRCSGNETVGHHIILPCRSLCQAYQDRCSIFLSIFYMPWPTALNCSALIDSPDPSVCIGYKEAHELPDLGDCEVGMIKCDATRCIRSSWVCDGYQDCEDRSDESHCASCKPYETMCSPLSTLCINRTNVCDGANHCYEGVDEAECVRVGDGEDERVLEVRNGVTDKWEEVCAEGWNQSFSFLTCQQLGYSAVLSTTYESPRTEFKKAVVGGPLPGGYPDRLQSFLRKGLESCPEQNKFVVKLICWKPVCGTRPAYYSNPLRVVGGDEVKPGTWPWVVSLHGGKDEKFFCGASVIGAEWVMTAGHCVGGGTNETSYWTLMAGHTRRSSYSLHRQIRKPRALYVHPEFDKQTVDNDIALIHLEKPFIFNDYLRPICLPQPGQFIDTGTRCIVAGWGKINSKAPTYEPAVRQVNLDVATWESCKAAVDRSAEKQLVPFKLTQNMFCAGGAGGHDACQGDSGGPLVCRQTNTTDDWYQAGIVSWGIDCAVPNSPGIYTKLPLYLTWIQEMMANLTRH